jgi:hypothetical protein
MFGQTPPGPPGWHVPPPGGPSGFTRLVGRPRVAALLLLAAALALGTVALLGYWKLAGLRDGGAYADGVVTEVYGGQGADVVVVFETADGQAIRSDVHDYLWDPPPRVGDAARLLYDPRDPARSARDARVPLDLLDVRLKALGSVVLVGAGIAAWNGRLRWLVRAGEPDEGDLDPR